VRSRLGQLGAEVYDADSAVRSLYDREDIKQAVRQLLGDRVFDSSGAVDRRVVAEVIFHDGELRRRLTHDILFPRTGVLLLDQLARFRTSAQPQSVLVLDAPTLFEAGRADWCDRILLVTAPRERRVHWATSRGWTAAELDRRDTAMLPEAEKRRRADWVIDNTGTLEDLRACVDSVWQQLVSAA
jgi:dephospho-CoA kinase